MTALALLPDDGIVDEVVVERAMRGVWVPLRQGERLVIAARMHARGDNPTRISNAVHMSHRQIDYLLACMADERAHPIRAVNLCDARMCSTDAWWEVAYPGGGRREWCLPHAAKALVRLDAAALPVLEMDGAA